MGLSSIFAGVVAIAKAIPYAKKILDKFSDYYMDYQISQIHKQHVSTRQAKRVLMRQIKGAKNDIERKALSIILADYSGRVQDKKHS